MLQLHHPRCLKQPKIRPIDCFLALWQVPAVAAAGIFGAGQEDVYGVLVGAQAANEGAQVFFACAGAASCGGDPIISPDVEENG